MNRLRFLDVKAPLARVLNVDTADPVILERSNEAHRRLTAKGNFLGTVQRYRICTNSSGCIAWPRPVETILAYWLCDAPGTIRNGWYEANFNSPGYLDSQDAQSQTLIDRGTTCVFNQPNNNVSTVMVQSDVPEAAGLRILIRGYDGNMQWVRTQDPAGSGNWIDGEYVAIGTTAAYTLNYFSNITGIIKPVTKSAVKLWQWDTVLNVFTAQLGYYEPDETVPLYRQSLIPGLGNVHGCGNDSLNSNPPPSTCSPNRITVAVKLRHIDLTGDNDFFLLGNLAALKLMVMAILKEERNLLQESLAYEQRALKELQDELSSFEGDGQVPTVKTESPQTWGANVLNPVTLGYRVY